MTHLACADDTDDELTNLRQLGSFADCLATIGARGLEPTLRHACNSAGVFFHRFYMRYSMVEEKSGIHHYVSLPGLLSRPAVHSGN